MIWALLFELELELLDIQNPSKPQSPAPESDLTLSPIPEDQSRPEVVPEDPKEAVVTQLAAQPKPQATVTPVVSQPAAAQAPVPPPENPDEVCPHCGVSYALDSYKAVSFIKVNLVHWGHRNRTN